MRELTAKDADIWRALRLDGIRRYPSAFLASEAEAIAIPSERDFALLDIGGRFAAFDGRTGVGIAGLNKHPIQRAQHRAEVGPFYVTPDAQGSGAARKLMQALLDHAATSGVWQLDLTVAQTNLRAIAFYESFGFLRKGEIPNAIIGENGPEHDYFYALELAH